MTLIAVLPALCLAAGSPAVRTIPAPVRLPAVTSMAAVAPAPRIPAMPSFFQPIAARDFESFEPAPAVELDLGLPKGPRTMVGGWVEGGYQSGGLGR